jgi:hypothetical protein
MARKPPAIRKRPGRQELAENRLPHRDRQREQQLDGADLALLGPQPHRRGRHHKDEQQRQVHEERLHIRLPHLEELLVEEGEVSGEKQEDHEENIGQRRRKVALQLPFEHRPEAIHGAPSKMDDLQFII